MPLTVEDEAAPGDLIVMTSRGRGGITRALLGSVAESLIRNAKAPTLLVPVTAPKSCTGHLLGAAGALEAAISCLSLRDRLVPATFNLDDPDDAVELDVVRMSPRSLPGGGAALSNSFGFGGHDVALAFTEA